MTRVEQKEKNCLVTLLEKDATLEEIKKDFARKLALERLRGDNLQDAAKKIKEDYTRKNAFIIQEILAKEEIVKKLSKELYKQEVALSRAVTSANITRTHHNCKQFAIIHLIMLMYSYFSLKPALYGLIRIIILFKINRSLCLT